MRTGREGVARADARGDRGARRATRAKERGMGVDGVAGTSDKDRRRFLHLFCSKRQIPESRPRRSVNAG